MRPGKLVLPALVVIWSASLLTPAAAQDRAVPDFPAEFKERVVFYDPSYDFMPEGHLKNGKDMVDFFVARGFVAKDAQELAQWMKEKTREKAAYGTVCFIGMGIVPEAVLWEGVGTQLRGKKRLIDPYVGSNGPTLLRQYMEAGGRVVWPSFGMLSFYQGEGDPIKELPRSKAKSWLADIRMRPEFWGHVLKPTGIFMTPPTEEGMKWGLTKSYYMQLAVLAESVTTAFSGSEDFKVANFFLKTLNQAYPGSGAICLPTYTDGKDRQQMEDFYRLTLYAGSAIEVPVVQAPKKKMYPITIAMFDEKKRTRTAFTRAEDIDFMIQVGNRSGKDLVAKAFVTVTDERANAVLKQTEALEVAAGETGTIVTGWSAADAAVGDYRIAVRITERERQVAESGSKLFIRPPPRQHGAFIAPWMKFPSNLLLRHRQAKAMGDSGMAANLVHLTTENADLMLRYGIPFMVRLQSGIFPKGEDFVGGDVCHPKVVEVVGQRMAAPLSQLADMPNLLPYAMGFDDWGAKTGGGWAPGTLAPHVKDEFRELTGKAVPQPPLVTRGHVEFPKGLVKPDNVWLQWNRFTADRLGKAFGKYARQVNQVMPGLQLGKVSGEPAHFLLSAGFYPPLVFGKERLSLISYYFYMPFEPQIAHLYWLELGRAANRDLPSGFVCDAHQMASEIPSYTRSQVFAGLAGGASIVSHFQWSEAQREARAELLRLSRELSPYMELFGSLERPTKPVGLLVPFTAACFDGDYALHAGHVFLNLLCAHVDAELVVEDEVLDGYVNPDRYKVILLSDVDWLSRDVAGRLEKYIEQGGTVLVDRMTEVPIKGAITLPVDLVFGVEGPVTEKQKAYGPPELTFPYYKSCRIFHEGMDKPYGDPKVLASIRKTLYPYAEPDVQSPADNVIIRRFTAQGAEYVWLVNVETKEEHDMIRRGAYWSLVTFDGLVDYLQKKRAVDGRFTTTVALPGGDHAIYDVLAGKRLATREQGARSVVTVGMQRFGGTLLAVLDKEITGIEIAGPRKMNTGTPAVCTITVNGPRTGAVPVDVQVLSPRGVETEYSRMYLCRKGTVSFTIKPAINDTPGTWTITARELFSGREARTGIERQ